MTVSLPIGRRTTKCLIPGASAIYLCNEGTGTVLRDFSGNGLDGTFGAAGHAPTWVTEGLSFDGSDDWVTFAPHATITGGSIVAVVYHTNATGAQYLFDTRTSASTYAFCYFDNTTGTAKAPAGSTIYTNGAASAAYPVGAWGVLAITGLTLFEPGATNWRIGVARASDFPLAGKVAAFGVWPFNLTPAQVAQIGTAFGGILAPRGITLA